MADLRPVPVRFPPEQLQWLDQQCQGAIVTRSEVVRHLVAAAMKRDQRRQRRAPEAAAR